MKRSIPKNVVGRLVKADSPNIQPLDKFVKRYRKLDEQNINTLSQKPDIESGSTISKSPQSNEKPELASTSCDSDKDKKKLGTFISKYEKAAPYFLFLSSTGANSCAKNFSITFPEILDSSFGTIVDTLHINEYVDIDWLKKQYALAGQKLNGLVMYKKREDNSSVPHTIKLVHKNQHSKLIILKYDNGARVVILTGNLREDDWDKRSQSVWISPLLKIRADNYLDQDHISSEGDSETKFRKDFIKYLNHFNVPKWCEYLAELDFSPIKVFFIGSITGHYNEKSKQWGIKRLSNLLSNYESPSANDNSSVVIQCTSLGLFDSSSNDWLQKEFLTSLRTAVSDKDNALSPSNFSIVFPTMKNYEESLDSTKKSASLHYSSHLHSSQKWIEPYLCQWVPDMATMKGIMPHSKCYTKVSSDHNEVFWVVITSANLSMAAWGRNQKKGLETLLEIKNCEAGVAFFPKVMNGEDTFRINNAMETTSPSFCLPFNMPLTAYVSERDKPYLTDNF